MVIAIALLTTYIATRLAIYIAAKLVMRRPHFAGPSSR